MGPYWLAVVGCLSLLATTGHSAAVPTQDTMVVTKVEDQSSTAAPITPDSEASTSEKSDDGPPPTEGPTPPIKLTEMDVRSEVAMRYAHTAVVTRVRNPAKRAQEATFRVLLPETAFISGFTMILDGKSYKAYVKGKEEAKQIYSDAVSHGLGAAHIATKARDSNHFTVSVNVEPETSAVFNLTYEELLVRRNKVYNHAVNLHPGELVPKLTVTVHIREAQKITALRVPEVRTGNEIDAAETDAQNSKAVIERGHDDREATITFKPDLEEQKRLRDVYAEKTKESQAQQSTRYYGGYNDEKEAQPEGVLGQFVVQYDVDRPEAGEILVNDGYFVHFFAPSALPPLNKHVVFVLDTSGSMMDRKIEQLRQAMQTILSELNPGDYFSIVEFASSVQVHDLNEADQEPPKPYNYYYHEGNKPTVLVPPSPATPDNVAKAKVIVSRLDANGGTNIGSALDVAVELIQKGVGWKQTSTTPTPPGTATSTASSNETPKKEEQNAAPTNDTPKDVVPPKDDKADTKDGVNKLEPIIIFLTDGDPTVGETNTKRIINHLTEKNYGENKASIFSLGFGEDADRKFLRKLSLRNEGFMRHIYEAADAALQLRDFYRQVSSPLLADVSFVYPPDQVKEGSVTKHKFRTFYAGSETVVAGRVAGAAGAQLAPHVYGICGVDDSNTRKRYEITPAVVRADSDYLPLERLWAYMTIKQLLDEKDAAEDHEDQVKDKENGPEKRALDIALKYEFVTPLTSLVVVKPNATNAVDAESVDKQSGSKYGYGIPLAAHSFASPGLPGAPRPVSYFNAGGNVGQKISYSHLLPLSDPVLPEAEEASAADYDYDGAATYSGQYNVGTHNYANNNRRTMGGTRMRYALAGSRSSHRGSLTSKALSPTITRNHIRPYERQANQGAATYSGWHNVGTHNYTNNHRRTMGGTRMRDSAGWRSSHRGGSRSWARGPTTTRNHIIRPYEHQAYVLHKHHGSAPGGGNPFGPGGFPSTPAPPPPQTISTRRPPPISTVAPDLPAAAVYHVEEYTWVLSLKVPLTDTISVPANQTHVTLYLSRDTVAPKESGGDAECARATGAGATDGAGAAGACVYLTRCAAATNITALDYAETYCTVNTDHKYAGVCCPKDKVDLKTL